MKKLPTIIFPHDGSIAKDDYTFDYWSAFLVSRGYAVLQMNFRGSSGYGFDFLNAGVGNWRLTMQNDVVDGTKWLINKGISDPDKIDIPLLIVHADMDSRVDISQARNLKSALESQGKKFTYIEQKGGDHFLSNQIHRMEFFKAMDKFLKVHFE